MLSVPLCSHCARPAGDLSTPRPCRPRGSVALLAAGDAQRTSRATAGDDRSVHARTTRQCPQLNTMDPRTDSTVHASVMHSPPRGAPGLPELVVRVLGPVDVLGAARPFRRAWTLDLVVYLAVHPRGATPDAWTTALWPDRLLADPTRHSTVSAARRALGRSVHGADHLPRCNGTLRLGPTVTTDWEQFRALAAAPCAPAAWEAALDLVRGRPFDGLAAPDWTVLEGLAARVEDDVAQLAIRLAEHHLVMGDGRAAGAAARKGLSASPYDERLYRLLLRAADCQANPAGVEAAMAELVRLVGPDRGALDRRGRPLDAALSWVHPETASLYRALSRHRGCAPVPAGRHVS